MTLPVETFEQRAHRREARKGLREGRDALNDLIRGRFARSTEASRTMQEFDRQEAAFDARQAALDQGSRGCTSQPLKDNDLVNARLRAAFRHEDFDDSDTGATDA